ncbi:hypothetical protein CPB85DRAFT_1214482 [Mucidula mucida]|nr:hypothetical protein CPB85DRAFT_1214482 [Mucidula mucida]
MTTAPPATATTTEDNGPGERIYQGPLTPTFRRLKILSLSSLGATTAISPFFFIIESNLPTVARISLAGIAVTTSLVSTAMVSYFTRPYVTSLRRIPGGELEITTYSLFLKPLITKIYDTDFLADTQRPFAKWQLPTHVMLPESQAKRAEPGTEETVAETFNGSGERIGSWVVKWENNGEGNCHALGSVVR